MRMVGYSTTLTSVSFVALMAFAGAAFAADVSLSNVAVTSVDGKSTATLAKVDVTGTNLTRDEVMKLLNTATEKDERVAISAKMKADKVSIPDVVIKRSDKPGQITIKGFEITKIDAGKFAKFSIASMAGKVPVENNDGDVTLSSGPVIIEDGNIAPAFAAIKAGDIGDGTWQFGKFSWSNFQATFPEKTKGGPVYHTVKLGSLVGDTKYAGDVPTTSVVEVKDMIFVPAPNSQAGQGMTIFGYKQVNLGLTMGGTYDEKAKSYKLTDFTLKGADTGVLSISALLGNIDKVAFVGDKRQRMGALMQGDIDNLKISFTNNGLFDKAVAFYGRMKGAQPDAVRQEWAGMVGGMLPMFLGGDASAMQSASAVGDFIKNAKNLTITATGKMGAVPFANFAKMGNPMELLAKLKIEVAANK